MTPVDFTTLSMNEVSSGLDELAREVEATFGRLDVRQLNWRPDAKHWSVAQCLDHLVTTNQLMFRAADEARSGAHPQSVWQRLPILPGVLGRVMIRSLSPGGARKFKAPAPSTPAASDLPGDILRRFVEQQRAAASRARTSDGDALARTIMTSPFARVVTYSVLDAWRLVLAHGRRHFDQARRVTEAPGFPTGR
jgi:hypothetical protein